MNRLAIMSDIHGRLDRLCAVIRHAQDRGADGFADLGDVCADPCHDLLRHVRAWACFGNYEVSQWSRLSAQNQIWVHSLPPLLVGDDFVAAHATPVLPDQAGDVDRMLDHMLEHNLRWQDIFPRLDRDENARWMAYAELLGQDKRVCFHGHTHLQAVWRIGPDNSMSATRTRGIRFETDAHYIVSVGSVGEPEDSPWPSYVLYDVHQGAIELQRVQA